MPSTQEPSAPSEEDISKTLSLTPPFSILDPKTIEEIAKAGAKLFFRPGEFVVREGDLTSGFFIILDGQLEAQQRGVPLRRMGRGQFFGETSLVEGEPRSADIVATQPTFCLRISGQQFRGVMRNNPEVSARILEEMIRRNRTISKAPRKGEKEGALYVEKFEFKSELARRSFDNLVDSFAQDYMVKKIVGEKCGWRSITDIAQGTGSSARVFYGKHGGIGSALAEPIKRGLIETRYFPGERGRGGEIMRFRIAYEKEPVKAYVNQRILKGRKDPNPPQTDLSPA